MPQKSPTKSLLFAGTVFTGRTLSYLTQYCTSYKCSKLDQQHLPRNASICLHHDTGNSACSCFLSLEISASNASSSDSSRPAVSHKRSHITLHPEMRTLMQPQTVATDSSAMNAFSQLTLNSSPEQRYIVLCI